MANKLCTKCKVKKTIKDFYVTKRDGIIAECKVCMIMRSREWDKKNLSKRRKIARDSYRKRIKIKPLKYRLYRLKDK